jgi:hypothetical protein
MEPIASTGQTLDEILRDCAATTRARQSTMTCGAYTRPRTRSDEVRDDALAEARRMVKGGEYASLAAALRSLASDYPTEYGQWIESQRRANDAKMNRERGFQK